MGPTFDLLEAELDWPCEPALPEGFEPSAAPVDEGEDVDPLVELMDALVMLAVAEESGLSCMDVSGWYDGSTWWYVLWLATTSAASGSKVLFL